MKQKIKELEKEIKELEELQGKISNPIQENIIKNLKSKLSKKEDEKNKR